MTDVIVVGGKGKMGSLTAATVAAQDDMRLAAIVDPTWAAPRPCRPYASLGDALAAGTYGVAVEFCLPATVFENARAPARRRRPTRRRRDRARRRADRRAARRRRGAATSAASSPPTSPSAPCS